MADVPNLRTLDVPAIQSLLGVLFPGTRVRAVDVIERARCGDGIASTADRIALRLEFEPGADAGLPSRMILKTLLMHPALRFGLPAVLALAKASQTAESLPIGAGGARRLLSVLVCFYQRLFPHAPDAMYANEVRFYTEVRPRLDVEAPRAFGGLFDERSRHFGILMEDLTVRGAIFPNATASMALDTLRDLITNLARLHAAFWDSPRLTSDLAWLPDRLSGGMFPVFDGIGRELIRYQVERHEFKAELLRPLNRSVDELWRRLWDSQRMLAKGPSTLLHGDPHVGNTYLLPDGTGGFLDFQLAVRGHWANDLTYLLVTALDSETRRSNECELIAFYLQELARHGVSEPPDTEEAWRCHRLAALWGLVIGWLITPPVNYGQHVSEANIQRTVAACEDLEVLKLSSDS